MRIAVTSMTACFALFMTSVPARDISAPHPAPQLIDHTDLRQYVLVQGMVTTLSRNSISVLTLEGTTRRFIFCEPLAQGLRPWGPPYSTTGSGPAATNSERYFVSDLRIGDIVQLFCFRVKGVDACYYFTIKRRPGGRVPPAPDENDGAPHRYHEMMQAYQDHEEKGTPLPAWAK
jgi:hypothetical protein